VHRAADLFQAEGLLKHCQVNIALLAMNISTGIFSREYCPAGYEYFNWDIQSLKFTQTMQKHRRRE
jgi:hypothetical protein